MRDPYQVLGIDTNASQDDIKKAYRKLAMQYHPDRGGDETKFKEIGDAYAVLGDEKKRAQHDAFGNGPHFNREFNFQQGADFNDVFNDFFKHSQRHRQQPTITRLNLFVDLETIATGGQKLITVQTRQGVQTIEIDVPVGIQDGETIRYPDILKGAELQITFRIHPDPIWVVSGLDLTREYKLDFWDFILGTKLEAETILHQKIVLTVPAGTQPNTLMRVKHKGLKGKHNRQGDMYIRLIAQLPENIPDELIRQIKDLRN